MKKSCRFRLFPIPYSLFPIPCVFFICFLFVTCGNPVSGPTFSLVDYENVGASVKAKTWTDDYDCSNFSTQFYQNCYKAGLPCRVRLGKSGGAFFSVGPHAWNSVKIGGTWVNWEPQRNAIYNGHTQERTPLEEEGWEPIIQEDITRIIYETVGKYVPEAIIDNYEIDWYWGIDSPFYRYFCMDAEVVYLSGEPTYQDLITQLKNDGITNNGSGRIYLFKDGYEKYIVWFFKYNDSYWGLEPYDPVEGRSITGRESLKELVDSEAEFKKLDVDLSYGG